MIKQILSCRQWRKLNIFRYKHQIIIFSLIYCFLALARSFFNVKMYISSCDILAILLARIIHFLRKYNYFYLCYIVKNAMYNYLFNHFAIFDFHVLQCVTSRAMASGGVTSKSNEKRNRLSKELSPYLLQHASNPVDWYYDLFTI